MSEEKVALATNIPAGETLPETGNYPSEYPDPPNDPTVQVGPDAEKVIGE